MCAPENNLRQCKTRKNYIYIYIYSVRLRKPNGMLSHPFVPSTTATSFTEFEVEDLPLGRTAALVPVFTVKELPLGRTL